MPGTTGPTKGKTQGRLDMKKFPKIALGARACGNDGTFGAATKFIKARPLLANAIVKHFLPDSVAKGR